MPAPFRNIRFVLVRPTRPGNIGSAARAVKNMGFTRLALVQPTKHIAPEAATMAYGADDVLERAKVYPSLPLAISRCHYVIGMTARTHKRYGKPLPITQVAPGILERAQNQQVAILFGPEDSGLSNEEIGLCQGLATIPTGRLHTSLNLAQAVIVTAYELLRTISSSSKSGLELLTPPSRLIPAESAQRERFYDEFKEVLSLIEFVKETQGGHIMADIRRIFDRAELDSRELRILRGILQQVRWAVRNRQRV